MASGQTAQVTHTGIARLGFGRFDKIAFFVFASALILTLGQFFYASAQSAKYITGVKKTFWPSAALAAAAYVFAAFITDGQMSEFITRYGIYFAFIFSIGFPLLLAVLVLIKKKQSKRA